MDYSELKSANPRLFWDGVCRGGISYSNAGALQTGGAAQFPLIEGILGGPIPPNGSSFNSTSTPPIGPGGSYPRPWRSGSQQTQNASYGSTIGPYARLVKIPEGYDLYFPNTCSSEKPNQCGGSGGGIYGRLGIGDGQYLGFRAQDWYNQNEGTYNTAYWNNELSTQWLTWKSWWNSASKTTITAIWVIDNITSVLAEVEVAYDTPNPGDDKYYPGPNLSSFDDYALPLLSVVIGVAVIGGAWI